MADGGKKMSEFTGPEAHSRTNINAKIETFLKDQKLCSSYCIESIVLRGVICM